MMGAIKTHSTGKSKQRQKSNERSLVIPKMKVKKTTLDSSSYFSKYLLPSSIENIITSKEEIHTYLNHDAESKKEFSRAEIYTENAIKKELFHEEFRCFLNRARSKKSLEHDDGT